ncbi:hypothetical protein BQ8482_20044 [Mesorhizobium delmotii]|uniref:Uncharacterized protein n=1 Tax=Mesorhizobium delmotii TaxID=1631247 RepID=A0A2P9AJW1_9HYPH|nr:hypothetical protein BQ8482_20044 [Mesorhizobium delmotii]
MLRDWGESGFIPAWVPRPHESGGEVARRSRDGEGGTALYESPLSGRFAATSPPLRVGEEPRS